MWNWPSGGTLWYDGWLFLGIGEDWVWQLDEGWIESSSDLPAWHMKGSWIEGEKEDGWEYEVHYTKDKVTDDGPYELEDVRLGWLFTKRVMDKRHPHGI